jgi:hypothetical protein
VGGSAVAEITVAVSYRSTPPRSSNAPSPPNELTACADVAAVVAVDALGFGVSL